MTILGILWQLICIYDPIHPMHCVMHRLLVKVMYGIKGGKTRGRSPKSDSKPLKVHPAGEFFCGKKAFIKADILLPTFM